MAFFSASAFSSTVPCWRGVASSTPTGTRNGSRYSWLTRKPAIFPTTARPMTTARIPSAMRTFGLPTGRPPLLLQRAHVRDDRPAVRRCQRPAVGGHQPRTVGDDVEDLPVRVVADLVLVER